MFGLQPPRHISTLPWLFDNALVRLGATSAGADACAAACLDQPLLAETRVPVAADDDVTGGRVGRIHGGRFPAMQSRASEAIMPTVLPGKKPRLSSSTRL